MQDKTQGTESTPALTERRACPRLRVTSLIYIDIGKVNGGIVTSLSENGLSLTAATALDNGEPADGPLRLRIQVPGMPEALEASGEIVWTSSSGKEARVRFVELADKAREQLHGWIFDQISSNGLRQGPPKLPKMQLPNSRRAKKRASKFSFADVASSRVDANGEESEGLPEINGEPGELPPLQAGTAAFRDGAEVVASAFESPAFTEGQSEKSPSAGNKQRAQATSDDPLPQQPSPSIPERRQHPRRQILLFTYAVLGDDNGGLVFNLGEGGLALTAAATLREHHFAKVRLRFPDSADWIETSGRLSWKSDSGKEAGIEFDGLPEDARARIREWVSQGEPAPDLRSSEGSSQVGQSGVQELPSFMDPQQSSAEPFEIPAAFQEQPFENPAFEEARLEELARTAAPSSALFKTGIKGILERASVRRLVAKIKPPRPAEYFAKPRSRVASKVLSIAAGVALAVGGWMFLQRTLLNEASGIVAQNTPIAQPAQEPVQKPDIAETEAGAVGATADPSVQLNENPGDNAATQSNTAKPSMQQFDGGLPLSNPPKNVVPSLNSRSERAIKEKPRSTEAAKNIPAGSSPTRSATETQRTAPSRHEEDQRFQQITPSSAAPSSENKLTENKSAENKSAETTPAEDKPVQIAQAPPSLNSNKDPNVASPASNSNPPQPISAPSANIEKEKLPVASKQPEPLLARTPVVSVSFDPFPSIRMPKAEKSKKSHQGKSLQMGRLVSRVDPVYPEGARQQGVEGTARVHAIFNRDGSVQSVISLSGPPALVAAAMSAVRQWHYSQTVLGGQAMETEEDVTVQFRLASPGSK